MPKTEYGNLYDKFGREIKPKDIIKVLRFVGKERRKQIVYEQAVVKREDVLFGGFVFWDFSDLNQEKTTYSTEADGSIIISYEIIKGVGLEGRADTDFSDRPQHTEEEPSF